MTIKAELLQPSKTYYQKNKEGLLSKITHSEMPFRTSDNIFLNVSAHYINPQAEIPKDYEFKGLVVIYQPNFHEEHKQCCDLIDILNLAGFSVYTLTKRSSALLQRAGAEALDLIDFVKVITNNKKFIPVFAIGLNGATSVYLRQAAQFEPDLLFGMITTQPRLSEFT